MKMKLFVGYQAVPEIRSSPVPPPRSATVSVLTSCTTTAQDSVMWHALHILFLSGDVIAELNLDMRAGRG